MNLKTLLFVTGLALGGVWACRGGGGPELSDDGVVAVVSNGGEVDLEALVQPTGLTVVEFTAEW